jgi:hypothetical protein
MAVAWMTIWTCAMTKAEFIEKLESLSPEQVESVLPCLEADLAAVGQLAAVKAEIGAGRRSARSDPLEDSTDVYYRARKSLS